MQLKTDKPAFYIEMIKLNRVEFDKAQTLLITALVIIGAGLLAEQNINLQWQQKVGAGVGFALFGCLFFYRMLQSWLCIRFATKQLLALDFITEAELQGVRMGKWQLMRYFIFAWALPSAACLFVMILVFIG